eukprot:Amastigsp_a176390_40.p4 type:complete len:180 gc:universal Amastigsp_a176390_40:759-220(-)
MKRRDSSRRRSQTLLCSRSLWPRRARSSRPSRWSSVRSSRSSSTTTSGAWRILASWLRQISRSCRSARPPTESTPRCSRSCTLQRATGTQSLCRCSPPCRQLSTPGSQESTRACGRSRRGSSGWKTTHALRAIVRRGTPPALALECRAPSQTRWAALRCPLRQPQHLQGDASAPAPSLT